MAVISNQEQVSSINVEPTTHRAPQLTERHDDIARVAWASGIIVAFGLALLVLAWAKWQLDEDTLLTAGFVLLVLGFLPFLMLAGQFLFSIHLRYQLAHVRVQAESARLIMEIDLAQLDSNDDGQVDKSELHLFLSYLNKLYFGGATTAEFAARLGIGTEQWRQFGDILIRSNLAVERNKRGGKGFELKGEIKDLAWEQVENIILKAAKRTTLFAS